MIERDAGDWLAYADRAEARERLGRPGEMEADLFAAARRGADEPAVVAGATRLAERGRWPAAELLAGQPGVRSAYCRALALLRAGHGDGYQALCARLADRMGDRPPAAVAAEGAWCFALDARATTDWSVPLRWIDTALGELNRSPVPSPDRAHAWRNTRGVLLYRAGRWREAAEELGAAAAAHPAGGAPEDWLFLALVRAKLGDQPGATKWLARAAAAPANERDVWARAEWDLLRREGESGRPPE